MKLRTHEPPSPELGMSADPHVLNNNCILLAACSCPLDACHGALPALQLHLDSRAICVFVAFELVPCLVWVNRKAQGQQTFRVHLFLQFAQLIQPGLNPKLSGSQFPGKDHPLSSKCMKIDPGVSFVEVARFCGKGKQEEAPKPFRGFPYVETPGYQSL